MNKYAKRVIIFLVLIIIFCVGLYFSLFYRLDIASKDIIFSFIRVPAVLKAIISGSALALAGMFLQAVSKNPLADPYLTGLSSGAGLGITLSILLFSATNYSLFGFVGALCAAVIVISLSGFSKFSVTKLILIGLSLNIFASSIISFLILTNADKAYALSLVLTGGFSNADVSNKFLLILFLVALVITGFFIPKLNLLRLDSKLVLSSNEKTNKYNIIFVIL